MNMNGGNMKPRSAAALAIAALFLLPMSVFAADSAPPAQAEAPTSPADGAAGPSSTDSPVNPYVAGEQLIGLSAGFQIPVFLLPTSGGGVGNLGLGGSFSFSYQYFVSRGLALGGNIAGAFNGTIGGSSIFIAPLGFTTSYWWSSLPFEFSVLGEAGAYLMRYNGNGIIDPFAKAGGGAYWRATSSWSLGLQAYLWFVPEIHYGSYATLSQYAGFVETSITAVYHL
jgi:hypothetical protein